MSRPVTDLDILHLQYTSLMTMGWMSQMPMYYSWKQTHSSQSLNKILEKICTTLEASTIPPSELPLFQYCDVSVQQFFKDTNQLDAALKQRYTTIAHNKLK
jgi:hypothetical protein